MLKKIKKILFFKIGPSINYSIFNPKKFNWKKIKEFLKITMMASIVVFLILLSIDLIFTDFIDDNSEEAITIGDMVIDHLEENYNFSEIKKNNEKYNDCNVAGIKLHGELLTYISNESLSDEGYLLYDQVSSEEIISEINDANINDKIKVILIEVDSPGGSPIGAEEVNDVIKKSNKPVIAYIRTIGTSAAYWAVSGSKYIIALSNSDVGSIGVTISYVDNSKMNGMEGFTFNQLSTGKYKDILSYDKPLTSDERQLIMRDLNIVNDNFIKTISENRKIEIEKVKKMADGSSMLGQMALENKLIDKVGTINDVKDYIKYLISEDVNICW